MVTTSVPVTESTFVFEHPTLPKDKECRTWYKVIGTVSTGGPPPLVLLAGGPGAPHYYLDEPFTEYAARTGRAVVFYDALGNGKSTHLREKRLDEAFWTPELFVAELDALVAHLGVRDAAPGFDLYGHSWGGMLAGTYAASPQGLRSALRRAVLASGPCRMDDWTVAAMNYIKDMPAWVGEAITKYGEKRDYEAPEYKKAIEAYYKKHLCNIDPWPEALARSMVELSEGDDTVYMTMTGPDEVSTIGNLRDFDMSEDCKKIKVPCLLINGEVDECHDICIKPWFKGIPKCKWITIPGGTHMVHLEQPKKYLDIVVDFLDD